MNKLISKLQAALKPLPPFKKVVVGVSGGMDSITLSHAFIQLGYEVIFAHLNHSYRGQASDSDERFVIQLGHKWGVPCFTKKVKISKKGNLENNSRQARYQFLEEVRKKQKAKFIAVAHHFDDQMETIMMHEARGAGLRGKRGMQVKNGFIIRPFLDITRHEIEIYIIENALPYVTDDSNYDLNLNRNYLRHSTIPALERKNPNCSKKVYQESLRASKKLDALSKKASLFLKKHAQGKAFDRKAFNRLNEEVKSEIIIQLLGANDLYKRSIERLMSFVKNGASGKKLTVKGKTFVIEYDKIIFYSKTKETALPKKPIRPNGIKWGEWKIESKSSKPLFVRSWKAGDRFQPSGMKGHKKLQDFFVDQKIPKRRRHQIPIIVDENDDIICVGTLRYSNQAKYLDVRISNSD